MDLSARLDRSSLVVVTLVMVALLLCAIFMPAMAMAALVGCAAAILVLTSRRRAFDVLGRRIEVSSARPVRFGVPNRTGPPLVVPLRN
jgi:hypothetical protein